MKCSAKRQAQFVQFQAFLDVEPHKMLHPSQTRWLSLATVVSRMLEQWEALTLYFTDMALLEKLVAAQQILECLTDPVVKLFYLFLQWVLPKFTSLNKYFQSEKVVVTELNDKLCELYREILLSFMEGQYVRKTKLTEIDPTREDKQLPGSRLYLGVGVMNYIDHPQVTQHPHMREDFFKRCRTFLSVAACEVKKRWSFDDELMTNIRYLHPKQAMSSAAREVFPSIIPLGRCLKQIVPVDDHHYMQALDDQWRRLPLVRGQLPDDIAKEQQPDVFWGKLSTWETPSGDRDFVQLSQFSLDALCLPHSNAECERVFSKVNLTKTKIRNRLHTNTINSLLLTSQCLKEGEKGCTSFQPTQDMVNKMNYSTLYKEGSDAKSTRRSRPQECQDSQDGQENEEDIVYFET